MSGAVTATAKVQKLKLSMYIPISDFF